MNIHVSLVMVAVLAVKTYLSQTQNISGLYVYRCSSLLKTLIKR